MQNSLKLRYPYLSKLGVGHRMIAGPYSEPNACSATISRWRQRDMITDREFRQEQWLLVNPRTLEAHKVYLIERTS